MNSPEGLKSETEAKVRACEGESPLTPKALGFVEKGPDWIKEHLNAVFELGLL